MRPPRFRRRTAAGGAAPLYDSVRLALLAAVVGGCAAYSALGLLLAISWCQQLFYGFSHDRVFTALSAMPSWRVILAPTLGGAIVGLFVWRVMPESRNYGPADVMQAIQENDGNLSLRTGIGSALASAVSIGAGASVGRYGPTVHLGASFSAWIASVLGLDRGQRIALVGSGVAAAIAASFNAPLGGVLFATEVMLGGRALRSFVPVTVAAVVGSAVARSHGNDFHLFDLSAASIQHIYEYPVFALTGVFGGLAAIALMRSLSFSTRMVQRSGLPVPLRPVVGGLLLGLIGSQFPQIMGIGDEVIWSAFEGAAPIGLLLGLVALKLIASSLSFGFGFSGGVFAPALFMGALLGAAMGSSLTLVFPELVSSSAIYALAGMGAIVSCVIGAPVATILIAFELTSSYPAATAVMISIVFAHLVSRRLFPHSYFTLQLTQRGVDVEIRREIQILRGQTISDIVNDQFHGVRENASVDTAIAACSLADASELLILDDSGVLTGDVTLAELVRAERRGEGERTVIELAQMPALVFELDMDLHRALLELQAFVGISVPVVRSREDRHLVGVVHENSVINAYNRAVEDARAEEHGIR